jgi:hypothetical protein
LPSLTGRRGHGLVTSCFERVLLPRVLRSPSRARM